MAIFFRNVIRFRYLVIVSVLGCTLFAHRQMQHLRFESDAEALISTILLSIINKTYRQSDRG